MNKTTVPPPCPHLAAFLASPAAASLRRSLRRPPQPPTPPPPRCSACAAAAPRLYSCLACAEVSCWDPGAHSPPHAAAHAAAAAGHEIAVDLDRAELFCCACRDQVYDPGFDAAVVRARAPFPPVAGARGRRVRRRQAAAEYCEWAPGGWEKEAIARGARPMGDDLARGLRGLNNLGSTCFLNSVLQALLHTPPLRDYFLSDRHNRAECHKRMSGRSGENGRSPPAAAVAKMCLACELDAMFSAVFSGDRKPFSPARFLYSWWQHAANLASYEQQDAHEFFISMLDGIHEKVGLDHRKSRSTGSGDCCIAHRVFSGILRSDVTCTVCGFTSTTNDPCIDFSLDLEPNHWHARMAANKSRECNGDTASFLSTQVGGVSTLFGCLDRFTRPERLGTDQKFFCQNCQVRQESLKQMSIKKLPLVSCFHIKRFEHSSTKNMSRKVDRYLQFPFSLDMRPYLSSSILRSRYGNRIITFDEDDSDGLPEMLSSEFDLFAVITHTGSLDSGHYVTYLRLNDLWYKCDDSWIHQVSEDVVRASQCYMMFYVQKVFHYKAGEKE